MLIVFLKCIKTLWVLFFRAKASKTTLKEILIIKQILDYTKIYFNLNLKKSSVDFGLIQNLFVTNVSFMV